MDPALLYALFGAGYSATEEAHVEAEERRREEGMRGQKKQNNIVFGGGGWCCRFLLGLVGNGKGFANGQHREEMFR